MAATLFQLVVGFACLLAGADLVVRGGLGLALRWRVPSVVVGLTVVSFASTAPELTVVVTAAAAGQDDLAIASVVGGTITNLFLILGLAALWRPISCDERCVRWMAPALLLTCVVVAGRVLIGPIGNVDGVVLLVACVAIFGFAVLVQLEGAAVASPGVTATSGRGDAPARALPLEPFPFGVPSALPSVMLSLAVGAFLLPVGAGAAVEAVIELAMGLGVPAALLGLTVVALGTSLPELATAVVALWQGRPGIAVGNVIGSSLLNLLLVLGFGILFSPDAIVVSLAFVRHSIVPMALGALVLALHAVLGWNIRRSVGALLVLSYVAFIARRVLTV